MRMRRWIGLAVVACVLLLSASGCGVQDQPVDLDKKHQLDAGKQAQVALAPQAGRQFHDTLSDGGAGPEMIVVPAGGFEMGGPSQVGDRTFDNGPVHEVTLKAFAMGRTEVTRGEFAKFVQATGYKTDAERDTPVPPMTGNPPGCYLNLDGDREGWKAGASWRDPGFEQDDTHPVTCVSWNDATAYTEWLRRETGKLYRLPTEAEQEYTMRAGTTSSWAWGSNPNGGCGMANGADVSANRTFAAVFAKHKFVPSTCDDGYVYTAPVGHFKANAFGLYDTVGNVDQWAEDCYHKDYSDTPTNGSAAEGSNCQTRVVRGGSWFEDPPRLNSSGHTGITPSARSNLNGFRVAQQL